ncbi:MAG: S53 family peptidase [Planctomycetia bacterium]|nr:S53 family peptidase [Planctomycetia bacterium]
MRIRSWIRAAASRAKAPASKRRTQKRIATISIVAAEIESLEVRVVLSTGTTGAFTVGSLVRHDGGQEGFNPQGTAGPRGYTPAQIRHAYGFDQITFGGIPGDGAGTTIAIVNAYDDPNIANDLHQFDLAYGLPDPPSFIKINQNGSTTNLPAPDAGWITEIALDVEWAHAIAPKANIVLVESTTSSYSDMYTAVNTARNYPGVSVVSMSWGSSEYSSERFDDRTFTTPNGHGGVTFVTASGDDGAPTSYPSASPNVLSVGGTTLRLDSSGNWTSESGWSGSGGGVSRYESQPSYQKGVVTQSTTYRADPDVAYDSDPSTGFGVYDSYNNGTATPWGQWGGTSDAAPQWSALIAIANQGRALSGKGALDGVSQTLPMLYSMSSSNFRDITTGGSTGSPAYSATAGYDLVTGRGSPYANLVVRDLVGLPPGPTLTSIATLGTAYPQTPFGITYATLLGASNAATSNGQPVQFRVNSLQNGTLSIVHNFTTTAVVASPTSGTLFGAGDTLIWTGPAGLTGSAVSAFSVTAFDGTSNSASAVTVKINVSALGTQFSLSGAWTVVSSSGATLGLGSITQTGGNLSLVNVGGATASAQYTALDQITSTNLDGSGTVVGQIDTTTSDQGRITWSNGTTWLRISLGGQYAVTTPGSSTVALGSITQNGTSLTFANGASSFAATITNPTQMNVTGQAGGATFGDGQIVFAGSGQVWKKLDLATDYTNPSGAATRVIQNGTTSVVFVNKFGGTSPGYWINATQLFATGWNQTVTTSAGALIWQDGTVWNENVVLNGVVDGAGAATITARSARVVVNDYVNGAGLPVHLVLTGTSSLLFIDSLGHMAAGAWTSPTQAASNDYPGDVATLNGSIIVWSSGVVWTPVSTTSAPVTVTDYTNQVGVPVHAITNSTSDIAFVDGQGRLAVGQWLSATQAAADAYPGDKATFGSNLVVWDDGAVWTKATSVPFVMTFTDANGNQSHVKFLNQTTLIGLDGALQGATGTRQNGKITWSNGSAWSRFDFNALNALFQMAAGYP